MLPSFCVLPRDPGMSSVSYWSTCSDSRYLTRWRRWYQGQRHVTSCGLVHAYQRFRAICSGYKAHLTIRKRQHVRQDMLINLYQTTVFTHRQNVGTWMLWEICVCNGGRSQFDVGSSVIQYVVKLKDTQLRRSAKAKSLFTIRRHE